MSIIKLEGNPSKDVLTYLGETGQKKLLQLLKDQKRYSKELQEDYVNDGAYITLRGKNYPNVRYALGCCGLENIKPTIDILIDGFINETSNLVSFRCPIEIDVIASNQYVVSFRAATLSEDEVTTL